MSDEAQILLVVGAYLALSLFVGWRAARTASDSATGFVAGDRSMGPVLMYFVTGATIFSAFAFLGAPGRAYSTGAAAFHTGEPSASCVIPSARNLNARASSA